jgi:hypothetical protein
MMLMILMVMLLRGVIKANDRPRLSVHADDFGPNTTTFIIPVSMEEKLRHAPVITDQGSVLTALGPDWQAEIYPTETRSTCHGISAAFGKVSAVEGWRC